MSELNGSTPPRSGYLRTLSEVDEAVVGWNGQADRDLYPWKPGTVREQVEDDPTLGSSPLIDYNNPPFAVHPMAHTQAHQTEKS
jgi:hypothetical protein